MNNDEAAARQRGDRRIGGTVKQKNQQSKRRFIRQRDGESFSHHGTTGQEQNKLENGGQPTYWTTFNEQKLWPTASPPTSQKGTLGGVVVPSKLGKIHLGFFLKKAIEESRKLYTTNLSLHTETHVSWAVGIFFQFLLMNNDGIGSYYCISLSCTSLIWLQHSNNHLLS